MTGAWRAVRLSNDVLHPPSGTDITFVVVLTTPKSETTPPEDEARMECSSEVVIQSEDNSSAGSDSTVTYKRKLEDRDVPQASKNPRTKSPDNYVRMIIIGFCMST